MNAGLKFDITNDGVVLERFREMSKNDLEFSHIKRDDLIESIAYRKRHEELLNKILVLDFAKVVVVSILVIVLIFKL